MSHFWECFLLDGSRCIQTIILIMVLVNTTFNNSGKPLQTGIGWRCSRLNFHFENPSRLELKESDHELSGNVWTGGDRVVYTGIDENGCHICFADNEASATPARESGVMVQDWILYKRSMV